MDGGEDPSTTMRWKIKSNKGEQGGDGKEGEKGERSKKRGGGGGGWHKLSPLYGKLRFNSRIHGSLVPAGSARVHAIHDFHAFYMVTTCRHISPRLCVKSRRESMMATARNEPLINGQKPLFDFLPRRRFASHCQFDETITNESTILVRDKGERLNQLLAYTGSV